MMLYEMFYTHSELTIKRAHTRGEQCLLIRNFLIRQYLLIISTQQAYTSLMKFDWSKANSRWNLTRNLHYENTRKFSDKNSDIFHVSSQNIDCGYSIEPPLTSTHNLCFRAEISKIMYIPVNPSFTV